MRHELVPPLLPLPAPPSLRSDWTAEGGCPYNSRSVRRRASLKITRAARGLVSSRIGIYVLAGLTFSILACHGGVGSENCAAIRGRVLVGASLTEFLETAVVRAMSAKVLRFAQM
jgi:hypothetical protein